MADKFPTFKRNGNSANIDFYKADRRDWGYVEVLRHSITFKDGKAQRVTPSQYRVTVYQYVPGRSKARVTKFDHNPKRTPPGGHLADSTVTRLVREHHK